MIAKIFISPDFTSWRQRSSVLLRAACASLAAGAALGIGVPAAQAAIVTGYVEGVRYPGSNMYWQSTGFGNGGFSIAPTTGRLYFSYSTNSVIEQFPGSGFFTVPLSGFFGFVSNTLSVTSTITESSAFMRVDESGSLFNGDNISFGSLFLQGVWDITIAGVQTVNQPAATSFAIQIGSIYAGTTFEAGFLTSASSVPDGIDRPQYQGISGLALNNGVVDRYLYGDTLQFGPGTGIVITSTGGGRVPEPSVLALLAITAAGAGLASKRRKSRRG